MEVISILMLATLVIKAMTVVKAIGKDWNMVLTQVAIWGLGIAVLFLASHAVVFSGLTPFDGGPAIGDYDGSSIILAGLVLGSTGAFAYDWKKAKDGTDSAAEPPLLNIAPKQ